MWGNRKREIKNNSRNCYALCYVFIPSLISKKLWGFASFQDSVLLKPVNNQLAGAFPPLFHLEFRDGLHLVLELSPGWSFCPTFYLEAHSSSPLHHCHKRAESNFPTRDKALGCKEILLAGNCSVPRKGNHHDAKNMFSAKCLQIKQ